MTITWTTTVEMTSRTAVTAEDSVTVEAIDYIMVDVNHGAAAQEVYLSTASAANTKFIAIISSSYPDVAVPGTPDITYKWNAVGTPAIKLSNHHIYSEYMDELITATTDKLFFYNAGGTDASNATITIIVGRDT